MVVVKVFDRLISVECTGSGVVLKLSVGAHWDRELYNERISCGRVYESRERMELNLNEEKMSPLRKKNKIIKKNK